jgi:ribosomal protein S18 acetylase RimI-like enzyme
MKIRRLTAADWSIFRDIRLDMLSQSPGAFGSSFTDWVMKPEAEIRTWLERIHTLGSFDRRTLVATAAMVRASSSQSRHRAEVIAVYARPEARGQGITATLLRQLAVEAAETGILQLELQVADDNAPAIALYRRLGFVQVGRIPRAVLHQGSYRDDLTMVWPLDAPSDAA